MLACAIVGISLAGFAVALQRSVEAATVARQESAMRLALQSRLAELAAETVGEGRKQMVYSEDITVEQDVEAADFRNASNAALEKVFRVKLRAFRSNSQILPVEIEALVYQP